MPRQPDKYGLVWRSQFIYSLERDQEFKCNIAMKDMGVEGEKSDSRDCRSNVEGGRSDSHWSHSLIGARWQADWEAGWSGVFVPRDEEERMRNWGF